MNVQDRSKQFKTFTVAVRVLSDLKILGFALVSLVSAINTAAHVLNSTDINI